MINKDIKDMEKFSRTLSWTGVIATIMAIGIMVGAYTTAPHIIVDGINVANTTMQAGINFGGMILAGGILCIGIGGAIRLLINRKLKQAGQIYEELDLSIAEDQLKEVTAKILQKKGISNNLMGTNNTTKS